MAELTFTAKNTTAQSLRAAPSRYNKSKLRYNFEVSMGERVAEVFYPHKLLPVQCQDVGTEDWIVITKGKVVSALGVGEELIVTAAGSGLAWPNASGSIPVFQNRSSTAVTANVDSSFWGYNQSVCGLLVPCNGGADRNATTANAYEYTANDVTAGTYKSAAGDLAAAGDDVAGFLSSGNIPIGAAMYDVYQDIRGQKLNYAQWDKWGIVNDWYVTVPFVREGGTTLHYFDEELEMETSVDDGTTLNALRNLTYLTIPSGTVPRTGATVKADVRGNYMIQDPFDTITDIAGGTTAANPTVQTVGRLVVLDTRFPKDLLNYVDTYEGSQMAGTDTAGLPYWLFIFCYNYLNAVIGSAPTIAQIIEFVKDGRFGMARIQLHVN